MGATIIVPTQQNNTILVNKTPFSGAAATIAIPIPTNTYDKIILEAVIRSAVAAVVDDVTVLVNNLSTAIYANINTAINRASVAAGGNFGFNGQIVQGLAGNTAAANVHSLLHVEITGNQNSFNKLMKIEVFGQANAATLNQGRIMYCTAVLTTPVTEFDLTLAGGNFMASGYYIVTGENRV